MSKSVFRGIAIGVILTIGICFQWGHFNEFPQYIHAWAQADHFAIARGFVRNDLNFFKPETYLFNHQFPHDWRVPIEESITAVDFPIHQFIPAIFMKIGGSSGPFFFRCYVFLWGVIGIFFLYRLAYQITCDQYKALFIAIFGATSPLFVYYQSSMLPSIPSLSCAIIGVYHYARFQESERRSRFVWAVVFLTLATLGRTTFLIALAAAVFAHFIQNYRNRKRLPWVTASLSFAAVGAYYVYNRWLSNEYGSLFLPHFMSPESLDETLRLAQQIAERWMFDYFSEWHYLAFGLGLLLLIFRFKSAKLFPNLNLFVLLVVSGYALFVLVMMRQFADHDYYFLDTFFLPFLIVFSIVLGGIRDRGSKRFKWGMRLSFIPFIAFFFWASLDEQRNRYISEPWNRISQTAENYRGAAAFLDELGIPEDSKVLAIDAVAPNIPFLLMDRKGYVVMAVDSQRVAEGLEWNYDVVTFQTPFFLDYTYRPYPQVLDKLDVIGCNGKISVAKRMKGSGNSALREFFGLNKEDAVLIDSCGFEAEQGSAWEKSEANSEVSFSGKYGHSLGAQNEFGPTLRIRGLRADSPLLGKVFVSAKVLPFDNLDGVEWVVDYQCQGGERYYESMSLSSYLRRDSTEWGEVQLGFDLGDEIPGSGEIAIYLWNKGRRDMVVDDLMIEVY